jgi:hypothetical protein
VDIKNAREHLGSNENQDDGKALLQVMETVQYVLNKEKERPQAQNGKNVGSEYHEKVLGYGKYGRYRIYCENDIGRFYHEHHHEK